MSFWGMVTTEQLGEDWKGIKCDGEGKVEDHVSRDAQLIAKKKNWGRRSSLSVLMGFPLICVSTSIDSALLRIFL